MIGGVGVCHLVGHWHGGAGAVELRQPVRDCGYHSPNHGVEGSDCYGEGRDARGGVNEGPTYNRD
jgi:hypothetical protein